MQINMCMEKCVLFLLIECIIAYRLFHEETGFQYENYIQLSSCEWNGYVSTRILFYLSQDQALIHYVKYTVKALFSTNLCRLNII